MPKNYFLNLPFIFGKIAAGNVIKKLWRFPYFNCCKIILITVFRE